MPQRAMERSGSSSTSSLGKGTQRFSTLTVPQRINKAVDQTQAAYMIGGGPDTRKMRELAIRNICRDFGFAEEDVKRDLYLIGEGASQGVRDRIRNRLEGRA